jgi:RNA polymerase sigma-70 factor (ECF subfamily)
MATPPMTRGPAASSRSLVTPEERQLLAGCLAGSPPAWEQFVARYAGLFAHVAERTAAPWRRPLAQADRDDVVAEILLACLRNDAAVLRTFAGRSSLPTYLTVIARRVAVRALAQPNDRGLPERQAGRSVSAGSATVMLDDREHVERLMTALDEREAMLVRLHHLEARSYGEISRLTGMPLGSIGPALSRAKAKLRALAGGPGPAGNGHDPGGGPTTTDGSARSIGS